MNSKLQQLILPVFRAASVGMTAILWGAPMLTNAEPEVHPVCLIGEWHANDLTNYMRSAIHVGEIQSVTGPYYVTFHDDGRMSLSADVTVMATSSAGDIFVERIIASGSADYQDSLTSGMRITNSLMGGSVDVEVNDQMFIQGADAGTFAFQDDQQFTYDCDADRMTLRPNFGDGRVAEMRFQRYSTSAEDPALTGI